MALEPGGYADKLGNRYEGLWTARQMLRVLREDLRSVTLEVVGPREIGADLWIAFPDGTCQAQQCKVRNLSKASWSVPDLQSRGILNAMQTHLMANASNQFALVTTVPSPVIHDLCTSARQSSGDPDEFVEHQINAVGEERRKVFGKFCTALSLSVQLKADRATAYSLLQRFFVELWPDTAKERDDLHFIAETLVIGHGATIIAVLTEFANENLRKTLDAVAIWKHLEARGLYPRRISADARTFPAVKSLQQQFAESMQTGLIANHLISRKETQRALAEIKQGHIVVLHGRPGEGKSGVLYELTQQLQTEGLEYLPIRLDRHLPKHTAAQFGHDLGLPDSPVQCLDAIAGDRPAVLILDQLDALRWTSNHSLNAMEVCRSLVREIRQLRSLGRRITIVLACRTYDLHNDPEIKNWIRSEKENGKQGDVAEIAVTPLSKDEVESAIQRADLIIGTLSPQQLQILASPQHLAMWVRIVQSRGAFEFKNRVELMREFWHLRFAELTERGVYGAEVHQVLTTLINYLEQNGTISAPRSVIANPEIGSALCAVGLIQETGARVVFGHQSYLDYQIATRVVRDIHLASGGIRAWLGDAESQSLFRREQLRQALCLLQEESPQDFLKTIKEILEDASIRFHLKHLCLEVIGESEAPSVELQAWLADLASQDAWHEHLTSTVYLGHTPFTRWLIDKGIILEWLRADGRRDSAIWLLRWAPNELSDSVANLLAPFSTNGEEGRQTVLRCLSWKPEEDATPMFNLRMQLAREGMFSEHVDWAELGAERGWALFDAIVASWNAEDLPRDYLSARRRSRAEAWSVEDSTQLLTAARSNPAECWQALLLHILRLAPSNEDMDTALELWLDGDRMGLRHGMESAPHLLVSMCIEAGKALVALDPEAFWGATAEVRSHASPILKYILVEVYACLAPQLADKVLDWLCTDLSRLSVGSGVNEPEWMPARRLLSAMSPHCSDARFRQLERLIIHYHSPNELRDAEYWLSAWRQGFFGDYWGRAQYFLLPGLSAERCSEEAIGLKGVLERRFEPYAERRFISGSDARGGFVGSTISSESLERMSDCAWLRLIENKKIPAMHGRFTHFKEDHCKESSVYQFSGQLAALAKRFPQRFARLALQFPADTPPEYKTAILDAFKEKEAKSVPESEKSSWQPADVDIIEEVLLAFGAADDSAYARQYCWLLYERADEKWSDAALDTLMRYATQHSDPNDNELNVWRSGSDRSASSATVDCLENNVLNCVRGVAALAISQLLWEHPDRLPRLRDTITSVCNDPHPAVLVAAMRMCLPLLNLDKDFAIQCFIEVARHDLRPAASHAGPYYFNCGMVSHFDQMAPVILRMLEASQDDIVEQGGLEVAARWLFHGYFEPQVHQCIKGSRPLRRAAATIATQFVASPDYLERCRFIIEALQNDAEEEVRYVIARLSHDAELLSQPKGVELVQNYTGSLAFRAAPDSLLFTLDDYAGDLLPFAELLFSIGEQFANPPEGTGDDAKLRLMNYSSQLIPLLLRLYEQANEIGNHVVISRCLDIWDSLFVQRVGTIELARLIG